MEVQELNPQKEVRWRCVEGPAEWIGTDITFQLSAAGQPDYYPLRPQKLARGS